MHHAAIHQFEIAVPLNGILRFCPNQDINGGKKIEVAEEIFKDFTNLVSGSDEDLKVLNEEDSLYALKGVGGFPMRVKCATMAWHAFNQALKD